MNDVFDPAAVVRLNGFSGFDTLRERGRLLLPGPSGEQIVFDLTKPYRRRDVLIEEYWRFHPRYLFFKSVRERARLADLGAGSGGLIGWKFWGEPERRDIFMYAIDIEKGEFFDKYVDYDVVELGRDECKFPDAVFDAAVVSHLIEHVADRPALAREIARIVRPGAKIYVEWPTKESGGIISRSALEPFGINCSTLNFFDDRTHLVLIDEAEARDTFEAAGFTPISSGKVINDYLYPELFRCGVAEEDQEATTYALWLAFRFSRYLIMEKAEQSP
jgi:SAM-dependent methyltransferase